MEKSDLALLDLVPASIFVLDISSSGDITYAFFNKHASDTANFSLSDYLGLNATHLYHGEYGVFAFQKHTECYLQNQPIAYVAPLPLNGKLRSIRTRLVPIMDSHNRVTRIIGASNEVTAELELDGYREESRNIETELQEFFYLAAHDLRSPMKKVQQFSDILREDFHDMGDGKLELIDMIEKISVESMSMIQRILQHAETTRLKESIENISFPDLCYSIITTLDPTRHHKYRVDECSIFGDQTLIQAVLRNIVDNALKHNEPNVIELDIKAENARRGYIKMTVTDNGKGMLRADRLFKSTDGNRSNSGFGLLAIRKLIIKAGGDIYAKRPDKGSGLAVSVVLPGTVNYPESEDTQIST